MSELMSQSETPFISVIVCAFNEEKLIESCLKGLINQEYSKDKYEVIVIDDESTDRTFEIVSDFIDKKEGKHNVPSMRVIRIKHGGLSIARNAGIQFSIGEIIAFIDGDAISKASWLNELSKTFSKGADYVGGKIDLLNQNNWVAQFLQSSRYNQFFGPRLYNDHFIGCNMAFRKEIFEEIGGFHENFVSRGDETTLRKRIPPKYCYRSAPNAIVLHERPDSLIDYFRIEWKSSTLYSLSLRASENSMDWKSKLKFIEQFLMLLFPFLFLLIWYESYLLIIPILISISAIVRRVFLRPVNRKICKVLMNKYGLIKGCIGHFLFVYTKNIIGISGCIIGYFKYINEKIIEPLTTDIQILKIVNSK